MISGFCDPNFAGLLLGRIEADVRHQILFGKRVRVSAAAQTERMDPAL